MLIKIGDRYIFSGGRRSVCTWLLGPRLVRCLGEVGGEKLGHAEGTDLLGAENLGHLLVGGEVLLVLGVLEVVLLQVGPELLDALGPGGLLLANDVGELGGELHGLGETGSLGHFGRFLGVIRRAFEKEVTVGVCFGLAFIRRVARKLNSTLFNGWL